MPRIRNLSHGGRLRAKWCSTTQYRVLFAAVAARDGMFCRWCGCAVHRGYRPPGERVPDDAATLDHLQPRRQRGESTLENLVMSCNRCNFERDRRSASPPITEAQLVELMGRL
jgi:hypothetical protein